MSLDTTTVCVVMLDSVTKVRVTFEKLVDESMPGDAGAWARTKRETPSFNDVNAALKKLMKGEYGVE